MHGIVFCSECEPHLRNELQRRAIIKVVTFIWKETGLKDVASFVTMICTMFVKAFVLLTWSRVDYNK